MTDWTETYRGTVPPWQCDTTEHFTIAYYFDRFEESEANLLDDLGLAALRTRADAMRRIDARFAREMRAGTGFHIESAAIEAGPAGLRLGHRCVDSTTSDIVTWFDSNWDAPLSPDQTAAVAPRLAAWNGPASEARPQPTGADGFVPTARGRVKPGDLDADGCFSLSAMVLRFSNASGQTAAAIGMDPGAMQRDRRGFSTFELGLRVSGGLRVDTPYLIATGIGHLGNSSMRMIHRLTDARSGLEVARLSQYGVNLDLDARRPTRWPEDVRARAAAMAVAVA